VENWPRPPLFFQRWSRVIPPNRWSCRSLQTPAASASTPPSASPATTTPAAGDIIRHVLYQPSRPTPDGRALLVLSPLEFLTALARLIPPPRVHRHRYRYHGVLAPNAGLRERVTALAGTPPRA
jgi:hypothetical protein